MDEGAVREQEEQRRSLEVMCGQARRHWIQMAMDRQVFLIITLAVPTLKSMAL